MSQGNKMLIGVVSIILSILLVTFMVKVFTKASEAGEQASAKGDKITQELLDFDKTKYEDKEVSGSDVLNAIKEFKADEFSVWVLTNKTSSSGGVQYGYTLKAEADGKYSLSTASTQLISNAKKITDTTYINPSANFLGSVVYDINDVVIGIKFAQQ